MSHSTAQLVCMGTIAQKGGGSTAEVCYTQVKHWGTQEQREVDMFKATEPDIQ